CSEGQLGPAKQAFLAIHSRIGPLNELLNAFALLPFGNSNRSLDLNLDRACPGLQAVFAKDPFSHPLNLLARAGNVAIENYDEFVPTPSSGDIGGAKVVPQLLGKLFEQAVSGHVPVSIVHRFELIQVKNNDAESLLMRHAPFNSLFHVATVG